MIGDNDNQKTITDIYKEFFPGAASIIPVSIVEVNKLFTINILTHLEENRWRLNNIPLSLITPEIAAIAVKNNSQNYQLLPPSYRLDPRILETYLINATDFKGIDDSLITKDVCLRIVKNSGYAIQYVPEEFKDDIDIILRALKSNGEALQYIPLYKQTQEMVNVAVGQNYDTIRHSNKEFRTKEIFIDACSSNSCYIKYFDIDKITEEMILEVLNKSCRRGLYNEIPYELVTEKVTLAYIDNINVIDNLSVDDSKYTIKICKALRRRFGLKAIMHVPISFIPFTILPF